MISFHNTKLAAILLAGSFLSLAATTSQATTINFDNPTFFNGSIANGYGGLDWSNMYTLDGTNDANSGYQAGVVSPDGVAYNAFANPASFSVGTGTFTLNSFFLTAAWNDGLGVLVQGFLNGNLVDTANINPLATAATLFTFNWSGIDTVLLTSSGGTHHLGYGGSGEHFALDDLTVAVSSVPVPAALPLLVTGIAGLGALGRRRAKRKAA